MACILYFLVFLFIYFVISFVLCVFLEHIQWIYAAHTTIAHTKNKATQMPAHKHTICGNWPRGVTVSTLDSESSDRGSNPREASWYVNKCIENERVSNIASFQRKT